MSLEGYFESGRVISDHREQSSPEGSAGSVDFRVISTECGERKRILKIHINSQRRDESSHPGQDALREIISERDVSHTDEPGILHTDIRPDIFRQGYILVIGNARFGAGKTRLAVPHFIHESRYVSRIHAFGKVCRAASHDNGIVVLAMAGLTVKEDVKVEILPGEGVAETYAYFRQHLQHLHHHLLLALLPQVSAAGNSLAEAIHNYSYLFGGLHYHYLQHNNYVSA